VPPNPKGCADFGRVLCCSSVKDHSGYSYSPSSRRAPNQNPQQRCYTSHGSGALGRKDLKDRLTVLACTVQNNLADSSGHLVSRYVLQRWSGLATFTQ
jgi:hypothetical protein